MERKVIQTDVCLMKMRLEFPQTNIFACGKCTNRTDQQGVLTPNCAELGSTLGTR